MNYYLIISGLVFLAATFGYINVRFFKLPTTIGLMLITILYTFGVLALSFFDDTLLKAEAELIRQIDFKTVLMDYMLSFLLFAGALHTNFQELKAQRWPIIAFATIGVVVSTFLIGTSTFYLLQLLGLQISYIHCLLFGAIISPTDPIAVLGILKKPTRPRNWRSRLSENRSLTTASASFCF